ncbi:MAG TPA: Lsr2 family protein [Actinomycetales bacterium]|uniref:Lsr2 family protein n=1 Tax=Dietzia sp. 179-F 9C3 NHS TaxID=3374295 RepID=UPI0017732541|nr:Lsr2 family protein [Actinomycetales bacterium]
MAQQYQVQYIDDIDGTELGAEANTIAFAFDGREYSIDLSDENAEAFREAIAPYIDAAQRVGATTRRRTARKSSAKGSGVDTKAVRAWARENGYEVSERGRIPATVMAAYAEAN